MTKNNIKNIFLVIATLATSAQLYSWSIYNKTDLPLSITAGLIDQDQQIFELAPHGSKTVAGKLPQGIVRARAIGTNIKTASFRFSLYNIEIPALEITYNPEVNVLKIGLAAPDPSLPKIRG